MTVARAGVAGRRSRSGTGVPPTRRLTKSRLAGAASVCRTPGSTSGTRAPCWTAPILRGTAERAQMVKGGTP